jgi:hypothetical protein
MSEEDFSEKRQKIEQGGFHSPMEVVNVSSLPDETSGGRGGGGEATNKQKIVDSLAQGK